MKKIAIALLITALVIILVVGCTSETSSNSSQNKARGKASAGVSNQTANSSTKSGADSSSTSESSSKSKSSSSSKNVIPRKLEYSKNSLPSEFENAVDNSFIVVVAFYDTTDAISNKVQNKVEEVVEVPDYASHIKYLSYEIGENTSPAVGRLTTGLSIKYMPSITIIDGDKNIVFEDSGFTETGYFEHALYNTVFKDKSPANNQS
ncbi:MAG: hypothetical protein E3J54_00555 [Actinobacteria bacterium]|nr:MAG: hypothetical protein E3J54_00555 [Actinomycetota bacterium]